MSKMRGMIGVLLAVLLFVQTGLGQNFSVDARRVGMGGVGDADNIAANMVAERQETYRSIPLPLGVLQILKNTDIFNPDSEEFDPVRAIEYAANPMHFTFNRDTSGAGNRLVSALVNGGLNRDLNTYRGFSPPSSLEAEGLLAPPFGKMFTVAGSGDEVFHGIYVGASPYVSVGTDLRIDPDLISIFKSPVNVYRPNDSFTVGDVTDMQGALAFTGGYRARLPVFGTTPGALSRAGLYVAANYHYLHGIHYDSFDVDVRFDTDDEGLVTLRPSTTPLVIDRTRSKSGNGFAIDLGTAFVTDTWEVNVGASGLGNRINWKGLGREQYVLQSLFEGGDFVENQLPAASNERKVTLPVQYSSGGAYRAENWTAEADFSHGFQDFNFHGGGEYRFGPLAFRGGERYSQDKWHLSGGIGLNITRGIGIDLAAFETTANIERQRKVSLALSLRLNRSDSQ